LALSVIAPCYNEELNIPELTRRVLNVFERGGLKGELIVVDDGSSDGTRVVIERMQEQYPDQVVGCFHPANLGMAYAWKTGVAAARAPIVAVIDADLSISRKTCCGSTESCSSQRRHRAGLAQRGRASAARVTT
jgi:phenylacetate-CoA ligase